jgi:hypothetical protein
MRNNEDVSKLPFQGMAAIGPRGLFHFQHVGELAVTCALLCSLGIDTERIGVNPSEDSTEVIPARGGEGSS